MIKKWFTLLVVLNFLEIHAQDITGHWAGVLKVNSLSLRLGLNITKTDQGLQSTLDSPDQNAMGIPMSQTTLTENTIKVALPAAGIEYIGQWDGDNIKGTFTQQGKPFPLDFLRSNEKQERIAKPQEPKEPYPYYSEDILFENKTAGIKLAGTLTMPNTTGAFPAVIMISGSGPQNRNEELLGHRPFLIWSDYLTRNGIAVLRFDDRGVAKSTGNFKEATSVDHASDVNCAVEYLKSRKEIKSIGLIGHSEGGLIAPMVAAKNSEVSFIVLLAGPGTQGNKLLLKQIELINRANGMKEDSIKLDKTSNKKILDLITKSKNDEQLKKDLALLIKKDIKKNPGNKPKDKTDEEYITSKTKEIMSPWPWMKYFLKYDPASNLSLVKCPVLAVNGEKDLQVPAQENLDGIKKYVRKGGNRNVTTVLYPGMNHLFQECTTGSPAEYAIIQQTVSEKVLVDVKNWRMSKFLIDANLPYYFRPWHNSNYIHVKDLDDTWNDEEIWEYAIINEFIILSKDSDVSAKLLLKGPPPKVIQFKIGNMRI